MKELIVIIVVFLFSCVNEKKENKNNDNLIFAKQIVTPPITCDKCSILLSKNVLNDLKNESKIKLFLCTFSENCSKNVEFSEISDEVIYLILQKNLNTFLKLIEINKFAEYEIFDKISTPLLDYDYDSILREVKKNKAYLNSKLKLIKALEKAKLGDT